MSPATQAAYRSLAANFYATRLRGEQPTAKRIADALKAAASEYRPDYWRRLRNSLAFDQEEKGFKEAAVRVNATQNPATRPGSEIAVKPKQTRIKRLIEADEQKLADYLNNNQDTESYYAVVIAKVTGARPAEFKSIKVNGNSIYITGAKKSHGGVRGADRVMVVSDIEAKLVADGVQHLKGTNIGAIQDRISAAGKRLWPQRKAVPSLYSWRHQMGSNLKASGLPRKEIAYLMGHQSTASVDSYGNRKTAGSGNIPSAPEGTNFDKIRELHRDPPTAPGLVNKNINTLKANEIKGSAKKLTSRVKQGHDSGLDYSP
jgi:integrase